MVLAVIKPDLSKKGNLLGSYQGAHGSRESKNSLEAGQEPAQGVLDSQCCILELLCSTFKAPGESLPGWP